METGTAKSTVPVQVQIEKPLHRQFKALAALNGMTLQEQICALIAAAVSRESDRMPVATSR